MKTEKEKLIDYLIEKGLGKYRIPIELLDAIGEYLESINPRNETDGHRRLEDNKAKKEFCDCKYEYGHKWDKTGDRLVCVECELYV